MPLNVGSTKIKKIYYGNERVKRIRGGTDLIFGACNTAGWLDYGSATSGLTSCTNTGSCSCSSLGSTGVSCDPYQICNTAGWSNYGNEGYICLSSSGISGTCSCGNLGATSFSCNSSDYYDRCDSVVWDYSSGTSGLTSCTATGTCSSCGNLGVTGNSCSSYSVCDSAAWQYSYNDGYVCSSAPVNLTTCSCTQNLNGNDYLCNANDYQDYCATANWSYGTGTSGLTSCTATGTCGCGSLGSTGNSCEPYSICNAAEWSYYTNDGYVCTSTIGLSTCNCSTNLGGTDYLCHANVYNDVCSSVGWSYGSASQVTSCSTSGSCSSCSNVGATGYSCSSGYSVCTGYGVSQGSYIGNYSTMSACAPSLTCSSCSHVGNTGTQCVSNSSSQCATAGWGSIYAGQQFKTYQLCMASGLSTGCFDCSDVGNQQVVECQYVGGSFPYQSMRQNCMTKTSTTVTTYDKYNASCIQTSSTTYYDRTPRTCVQTGSTRYYRKDWYQCLETSSLTRYTSTPRTCAINTTDRYYRKDWYQCNQTSSATRYTSTPRTCIMNNFTRYYKKELWSCGETSSATRYTSTPKICVKNT